MDRVELIQRSLRAHAGAWVGLVPVLGLPFAVSALVGALRCRSASRTVWNPAEAYVTRTLLLVGACVVIHGWLLLRLLARMVDA